MDPVPAPVPAPAPEYVPLKRRVPRKRDLRSARPPGPITVVSVDWNGTNVLVWHFSADVTLEGGNVPELENDLDGTGAWQSPARCSQGSPTSIAATYPDVPGEATPWRIAAEPSNLEQADRITVPEGGNVV
jgi:hypothetical protein